MSEGLRIARSSLSTSSLLLGLRGRLLLFLLFLLFVLVFVLLVILLVARCSNICRWRWRLFPLARRCILLVVLLVVIYFVVVIFFVPCRLEVLVVLLVLLLLSQRTMHAPLRLIKHENAQVRRAALPFHCVGHLLPRLLRRPTPIGRV